MEPTKKVPSAPKTEPKTESDISSRYEKLFGKNSSSSEDTESFDKTESRFEKLFGVKNSTKMMKIPMIHILMPIAMIQKRRALSLKNLFRMMKKISTTDHLKSQSFSKN